MGNRIYRVVDGGEHTPVPVPVPQQPTQGVAVQPEVQSLASWKAVVLTLGSGVLTGALAIAGSHIGGVTKDDLKKAQDAQTVELKAYIATTVKAEVTADSTAQKVYIDKKFETWAIYNPPRPVRRAKKTTNEHEEK